MANFFDEEPARAGSNFFDDDYAPPKAPDPQGRGVGGWVGDTAADLARGVVGFGESVVGLGDLATFGMFGKGLQELGYEPAQTQNFLSGLQTEQRQQSDREVEAADGFWETAKAIGVRPDVLIGNIVQALPGTIGSGAAAGLLVKKLAGVAVAEAGALGLTGQKATEFVARKITEQTGKIAAAAAAAEGAQSAGSIAERARQGGRDWDEYVLPSLGAGLGTAAINMISGGLARKVGIGDVETSIAQRAAGAEVRGATARGIATRVPLEALKEGVLEEAPQSYQEKVFENVAMGEQDIAAGADKAAATGMLAGMGLGGANAAITPPARPPVADDTTELPDEIAPVQPTLLLENNPDPFISFPDGSVGHQADVDNFINSLPEDEQIPARARLYGLAEQSATPTVADIQAAESVDDAIATADAILSAPTEFDADLRNQQIDAAFNQYMGEIRQREFDLAEQARRDADIPRMESQVRDERVDLANAITEAQGFDTSEPTAMELAMQAAQQRLRTVTTPVSQRAALEAPAPATQAAGVLPTADQSTEGASNEVLRNFFDGPDGVATVPDAASQEQPAVPVQAEPGPAVVDDGANAAVAPDALTPEQNIEQAKSILNAAGVKGKERLDVLAQVRSGDLPIGDVAEAYSQEGTASSPTPIAQPAPSKAEAGTIQSVQQVESTQAKTDALPQNTPSKTAGATKSDSTEVVDTSPFPVESKDSVSPEKAAPVKLEFDGKTFDKESKAITFLNLKRVAKDYRIEQTGRDKYELVPAVATKDDKRARIDSREARLEDEIAKAKANAAARKGDTASAETYNGKPPASWVIKEKGTGKVILETFDKKKVDALNADKYEAVPIQQHLASLSEKKPEPADATKDDDDAPRYSKSDSVRTITEKLETKYPGLKLDVMDSRSGINVSRIVVPKQDRNQGTGTAVMQALIEYADQNGKTLTLSPSADFGGSVSRLKSFYKAMGFVENSGRNKDFEISESMYRPPAVRKSTGPATANAFTTETIIPALDTAMKRYGKDFVKNLLATGKVKIVTSKEAAVVLGSQPEGPAFFNPKTGLTYIIADRIGKNATPEQLHGLVLHEVANHALQLGRKSDEFKKLLANLVVMEKAGNVKVRAAAARADDAGTSAALRLEELAGYLIEQSPELSIAQRIVAWFRSTVRAFGQSLPIVQRAAWFKSIDAMTVEDIVYAAQNVLQGAPSALADQVQDQAEGQPAFTKPAGRTIEVDGVRRPINNSKGQPVADTFDKQKAFWGWFADSNVKTKNTSSKQPASEMKPLVVYHATKGDFANFDISRKTINSTTFGDMETERHGIFFSEDAKFAENYSAGSGQNVMPSYLSIQNPIYLDEGISGEDLSAIVKNSDGRITNRDFYGVGEDEMWQAFDGEFGANFVAAAKLAGFDGAFMLENNPATGESAPVWVAFEPSQIKSTTGNSGSFSPDTSDIRYSKSVRTGTEWVADEPSRMDDFLYALQDKQIDTKRTVEAITKVAGKIADELDPRLQETLFSGRSAKATQDFAVKELKPLYIDMQARNVTMDELQEFLHALHAKERNAQIAKINTKMPDGGSGMKNAEADKYMSGLSQAKRKAFDALAKRVDAINKETQRLMVDAGLEKQSTIDAWNAAYKHYVPLQRAEVADSSAGIGQGFSVRGASTRRAMGSDKEVIDILANVAMQRERAILRAEKNKVSTAVYGLAIDQPNSDFWLPVNPNKIAGMTPQKYQEMEFELIALGLDPADAASVMKEPKQRYVDPRTGLVSERINPALRSAPNVLALRVNGEDRFVFFSDKDARAQRMAVALKNLDAEQLGVVLGAAAKVSRWFASVNTQYNPVFGVVNVTRDVQGALMNISTTEIAGKQKAVMGYTMSAMRGIYADIRAQRAGRSPISPWARLYEEFQKEGGQTGFRDMFSDSGDRARALQSEIDQITEGKLKGAGRAIFGWLSDYNETLENAVRLAAYKVATEQGISKQRAAVLAKELTVNFNRKGTMALQAGALYAFFNASVQGTNRLVETLRGPAGKKIIAGGLLLGVMQALMFAAAGFDDGEPPEFVKERSIVIPTGNGKYIAIPMPLGFHVVPSFSRIITEWAMSGGKNTAKRTADIFGLFASSFNPIGSAGMSIQSIAPTAVDPLVALSENRDFTGKQIAKEDMSGLRRTPGYLRAKDTASELSKTLSYYLNLASGGTKYQAGVASPTPDQIDYLIGQVTGGVGRETLKLEQAAVSAVTGEDLPPNKVPLIGRFYGDTQGNSAESAKFYDNIRRMNGHKLELEGRRKAGENVAEYIRDNRDAVLANFAMRVQNDVSDLNKEKRRLIAAGAPKERVKMIETMIAAKMKKLNDQSKLLREKDAA